MALNRLFLTGLIMLFLFTSETKAQEVKFGFGAGQGLVKGEQSKERVAGIRYHAFYDYQPYRSFLSFGFSASHLQTNTNFQRNQQDFNEQIRLIPVAFVPKLMLSENDSKAFVKGMIGAQHIRSVTTSSSSSRKLQEFGFYGGLGAGVELAINSFLFTVIEYELGFVGSRLVNNPMIHSGQVALGIKFN